MGKTEMAQVADFLHRGVQISLALQKEAGSKLLKDFVRVATEGDGQARKDLLRLKEDVKAFATKFPLPGILDTSTIKAPATSA